MATVRSGILNIFKPAGLSSFAGVRKIRRATAVEPVGHGGTLDPSAEGVLPILLGRATRLTEFVHEWPKTYLATLQLGAVSETHDGEGRVTQAGDATAISAEHIRLVLPEFTGRISQVPPMHSALKHGGEALYRKARRGEVVERVARAVEISLLRLVEHGRAAGHCQLEIICGKGMYVRSLAHDIGARLGCGAYLAALVRTAFGPLRLSEAASVQALVDAGPAWDRWLLPMDLPLRDWPAVTLEDRRVVAIRHGRSIPTPEASTPGRYRLLDRRGELLAWGTVDSARIFQPRAVFAS